MQSIDLLVRNARIVTPGEGKAGKSQMIAVNQGCILEIGDDTLAARYAPEETIDAAGMYLFPGFINTHNHLFQVLTKGVGKEKRLWDWLENYMRRMTPHINEEDLYYAAMCGCMENIRSGVTTMLDYQYLHSHIGQYEAVCQAFRDCGIRGYVGRVPFTSDYQGLSQVKPESPSEYIRAVADIHSAMKTPDMLDVALIAPGMPGLLEETGFYEGIFRDIRECAEDLKVPYTQHLLETDDDDRYMLEKIGESSVAYLDRQEFFGPRCILAHCVKTRPEEIELFHLRDVKVSHNPVSNMILASGTAPITHFLQADVSVSLGTDGAGSNDSQDMLETLKFACLLQKVMHQDAAALTASKTLQLATEEGARALNRTDLGKIETGKKADFFLYNPSILKSAPVSNPIASLVYCSSEENIHTVVINGRIVMRNGTFPHIDEEGMIERLEYSAARIRRLSGVDYGQEDD